VGPGYAPGCT